MRRVLGITIAVFALLFTAVIVRAENVEGKTAKARLLVAENGEPSGDQSGIQDILPQLQATLKFKSYRLLTTKSLTLKSGARTSLGSDLSLSVTGIDGESVTVEVNQGKQRLLQTRLQLAPGRPVILGGIPGENNATLILAVSLE
jgi:hypothetical protein